MECNEIHADMVARLDGELDPVASSRLDDHVSACAACAADLAILQRLGRAIAAELGHGTARETAQALSQVLSVLERENRSPASGASPPDLKVVPGGRRERPGAAGHALDMRAPIPRKGSARSLRMIVGGAIAAGLALVVGVGVGGLGAGRNPAAPEHSPRSSSVLVAQGPNDPEAPAGAVARGERSAEADGQPSPSSGAVVAAHDPAVGEEDLQVPDEVLRRPGLFLDIPIVRRLDKLRSLEAVHRQSDEGSG